MSLRVHRHERPETSKAGSLPGRARQRGEPPAFCGRVGGTPTKIVRAMSESADSTGIPLGGVCPGPLRCVGSVSSRVVGSSLTIRCQRCWTSGVHLGWSSQSPRERCDRFIAR